MNTMPSSNLLRRILAGAALASALALSSGCFLVAVGAAGAAGAGTVAYIRGELDASLGSRLDAVVGAADSAIAQLQFAKISDTRDAFSAVIVARTAQDQKITITVTKEAGASSARCGSGSASSATSPSRGRSSTRSRRISEGGPPASRMTQAGVNSNRLPSGSSAVREAGSPGTAARTAIRPAWGVAGRGARTCQVLVPTWW